MDSSRMFVILVIYFINKSEILTTWVNGQAVLEALSQTVYEQNRNPNINDAQFISEPGNENKTVDGCLNGNVTLSWNITNYENVLFVTWKKGASTIMTQNGQNAAISTVSNIMHGGNGAVVIVGVQSVGKYSCDIVSASGSLYSSSATLSILVAPTDLPPSLESVVENNSINHTGVLVTKATPEVDVTIKIGSDEKSSASHSVPYESEDDISCCVSGDAVICVTESNVTKQCWKFKGSETSTTQRHATSSTMPTTVIIKSVTRNTIDSFPTTRDFVLLVVGEIIFLTIVATIVIYCFKKYCLELPSKCEKIEKQAHVNERNSHIPEHQENSIL